MIDTASAATAVAPEAVPRIGHGFRLQWEPAQNAHVLLYPEGMVTLNASAAAILERCDGKRTLAAIIADLEDAFSQTGLDDEVLAFIRIALEQRWLEVQ